MPNGRTVCSKVGSGRSVILRSDLKRLGGRSYFITWPIPTAVNRPRDLFQPDLLLESPNQLREVDVVVGTAANANQVVVAKAGAEVEARHLNRIAAVRLSMEDVRIQITPPRSQAEVVVTNRAGHHGVMTDTKIEVVANSSTATEAAVSSSTPMVIANDLADVLLLAIKAKGAGIGTGIDFCLLLSINFLLLFKTELSCFQQFFLCGM